MKNTEEKRRFAGQPEAGNGLKIPWPESRVGSIPAPGTKIPNKLQDPPWQVPWREPDRAQLKLN